MAVPGDRDYWNHNTAYHPWLVAIAAEHRGDVLDVGCGDGLLAQRLAPVSRSVTGIDPDPGAIAGAADRLALVRHVTVSHGDFQDYQPGAHRFDLITFVASLHHMDLRASLIKARDLLTSTGEIAVVGCSANRTVRDWVWSAMCVPAVRIGSWLHSETRNIGVVVQDPKEGLDDIRSVVDEVLPGPWCDARSTTATYCAGAAGDHLVLDMPAGRVKRISDVAVDTKARPHERPSSTQIATRCSSWLHKMPCPTVEAQEVKIAGGDHHVAGTPILRGREAALASEVSFAAAGANATDAPGAWGWLDGCDSAVVVALGVTCPRPVGVISTGRDVCPDVERAIPSYV